MSHSLKVQVTPARGCGNPDVRLLASPRLLPLFQEVATRAIGPGLASAEGRVDAPVRFAYSTPTRVAMRVRATAALARAAGRRLLFWIEATDRGAASGRGDTGGLSSGLARFAEPAGAHQCW